MGTSRIVPIILKIDSTTPMAWRKEYGKPTLENLEKWITEYSRSLEIGGVNQHVSLSLGYVPYPRTAKIIRQRTGEVLASWKAAMFQVY